MICDKSLGRFASETGGPGALLFPCCVGELSFPGVCGVDGGCDVNRGNAIISYQPIGIYSFYFLHFSSLHFLDRTYQWPTKQDLEAVDRGYKMLEVRKLG